MNNTVETLLEHIPDVTDLVFNYHERPITYNYNYNYNIAPGATCPDLPTNAPISRNEVESNSNEDNSQETADFPLPPNTNPSPERTMWRERIQTNFPLPPNTNISSEHALLRESIPTDFPLPPTQSPSGGGVSYEHGLNNETTPPEHSLSTITTTIAVNDVDPPPGLNFSMPNRTETNDNGSPRYTTEINATIDYELDMSNIGTVFNITDALTASIANSLENIDNLYPNRLSIRELLSKTTNIIYKDISDAEEKCHICNEIYTEFDICRRNNLCEHYFHQKCIDNWYTLNTKCPICQQNIN